jgi:hypothetical protein
VITWIDSNDPNPALKCFRFVHPDLRAACEHPLTDAERRNVQYRMAAKLADGITSEPDLREHCVQLARRIVGAAMDTVASETDWLAHHCEVLFDASVQCRLTANYTEALAFVGEAMRLLGIEVDYIIADPSYELFEYCRSGTTSSSFDTTGSIYSKCEAVIRVKPYIVCRLFVEYGRCCRYLTKYNEADACYSAALTVCEEQGMRSEIWQLKLVLAGIQSQFDACIAVGTQALSELGLRLNAS